MAYKQISPIPIIEGGTNAQTMADNHGVVIFDATSLVTLPVGTAGYVLTSNGPGVDPSFQNIQADGAVTALSSDSGTATPIAGVIDIAGGSNINTSAVAGELTVDLNDSINVPGSVIVGNSFTVTSGAIQLQPFTTTGALVSNASGVITDANASTSGFVLTSNGASSVPTFKTISSAGAVTSVSGNSGSATPSSGVLTISGSGVLSTSGSGSTLSLTSTAINVVHSGSGDATASSNAITITGTGVISTTATSATLTIASTAANVIHSSSGNATASSNAFSIVGAGTVSTTATGSTVTITGTGGGLTFTEATGATLALAVNSGYLLNRATLITATLPATAAVGDIIAIVGSGAGGWLIAQNSGQTIHFGSVNTTTGATGSLASSNRYDSLELICNVANTDFVVRSSIGNITYV